LISLGSVFLPSLLAISGTLFFELDPYSFILRDIFHHPPNNALILIVKCLPLCYASHIGWFGLLSVMVTALIQLHYAFSMIKKCLALVIELTEEQLLRKNRKKRISIMYNTHKRQLRVIQEVLFIIKVTRLGLALADEAFYLISPFLLLFGEIIFISCSYATIKMYGSIL